MKALRVVFGLVVDDARLALGIVGSLILLLVLSLLLGWLAAAGWVFAAGLAVSLFISLGAQRWKMSVQRDRDCVRSLPVEEVGRSAQNPRSG